MVECNTDESGARRLIAAAWHFASRFLGDDDPGVRQQIDWMSARTGWLLDTEPAQGIVTLTDDTRAVFLTSGRSQGIAQQFLEAIGGEAAERVIIVSPYWDTDLGALYFLLDQTGTAECYVLVDRGRHFFPVEALRADNTVKLINFKAPDERRFVHAKAVIVQTARADHVLYGSANCTFAAMGNEKFCGIE